MNFSRKFIKNFDVHEMDIHVHTAASKCSSRPLINAIQEGITNKLKLIGIVDHLDENNLNLLLNRAKDNPPLKYKDNIDVVYGIEIDFFEKKQELHSKQILSEFDFVCAAIHWLNNYPVDFFPETKEENKKKGLKPIDLRDVIVNQIEKTTKEQFFELYIETVYTLLGNDYVDVWVHPFRSLGFLLIYNRNYLDYFIEKYVDNIIDVLKNSKIAFELNEGLFNNLRFRGGVFFNDYIENEWLKFYSKIYTKMKKNEIPIVYGTDSHSKNTKIGNYNWVKKVLNLANK